MKGKKLLSLILAIALCVASVPQLARATATEVGTENALNEAITAANEDDIIRLSDNIVLNAAVNIPADKKITLELNGHTLSRNPDAAKQFSVITNAGNLTITDSSLSADFVGTITGGTGTNVNDAYCGGGIYNTGTLTISKGKIVGNTADYGGGIYNAGELKITGAEICANQAVNGGGIYNAAELEMIDCTVADNTAINAGGIFTGSNITVGGSTQIRGNEIKTEGGSGNLQLAGDAKIVISQTSPLTEGAEIILSLTDDEGSLLPDVFTTNGTAEDAVYFSPDAEGYGVAFEDGHLALFEGSYYVLGYNGVYDGEAHDAVTINVCAGLEIAEDISYQVNDGEATGEMPKLTDAGEYTVKVQFSETESETVTCTITKRTVTLYSESATKTYDGTALECPTVYKNADKEAVDTLFASQVTDLKATGSQEQVGISTNVIIYTPTAAFKESNYDIQKTVGTLEVTAAKDEPAKVDINALNAAEKQYGDGEVKLEVKENANAPKTNMNMGVETLIAATVSADDLQRVSEGEKLDVWLEVNKVNEPSSQEAKEAIEKVAGDRIIGSYLDITLNKQFEGEEVVNISQTANNILISMNIEISEEWQEKYENFSIIRYHDGEAEELTATPNKDGETCQILETFHERGKQAGTTTQRVEVEISQFSDYAIVMTAKEDTTEEEETMPKYCRFNWSRFIMSSIQSWMTTKTGKTTQRVTRQYTPFSWFSLPGFRFNRYYSGN